MDTVTTEPAVARLGTAGPGTITTGTGTAAAEATATTEAEAAASSVEASYTAKASLQKASTQSYY